MKRTPYDITRTVAWQIEDAKLFAQVQPDIELIQKHGCGDFLDSVAKLRREIWEANEYAKRDFRGWTVHGADFAERLGFDRRTAESIAAWFQYREPLRRMAAAIRAEADRIRKSLDRKGAAK